ncbi:MAG: RNA polymerase sigma factor [Bacteroidetes bacterium]|nr:RNA polymerase sigma factor [Bacteroidota bacterium]
MRRLYERYNKRLTLYAYRMLSAHEEATDVAQDVWARVIEQRATPQTVSHVAGYLFTIARHLCFDRLRARRDSIEIGKLPEDLHPIAESNERSHLEDIVVLALERLTPEDRELLVMHTYLGYGYDEIAVMQSKSPEAVWTKASRARAKLREIVRSLAEREGVPITRDTISKNR